MYLHTHTHTSYDFQTAAATRPFRSSVGAMMMILINDEVLIGIGSVVEGEVCDDAVGSGHKP